jgi:iron complex transport system ATP-binding protein
MNSEHLLRTHQLSIGHSANHVLFNDLNLHLQGGELVCFMGPNGIGKSTLIRTLAGLQQPLSGTIDGRDEKKIAVVLTDRVAASHMTVAELIAYGRYPYLNWDISLTENDRQVIEQCIDTVRIRHLLNHKLYELSDGQMQLVMIARALTQETPILLLDEPTAHLDLNNRLEIMNLLRKLSRTTNKAILVATHELDLALQTADLIWLTTANRSIKTGIPEDLVLDGSIDEVFQFKGFDLKTGKVEHEPYRKASIHLIGEGVVYLWTKNALERVGFTISEKAQLKLSIERSEQLTLRFNDKAYHSIKDLLEVLISYKEE